MSGALGRPSAARLTALRSCGPPPLPAPVRDPFPLVTLTCPQDYFYESSTRTPMTSHVPMW
eukprot:6621808-Prymnesium_polylepis.2